MDPIEAISRLALPFLTGADVSIAAANRIEAFLSDTFPDDDHVQETCDLLAVYRPGGGEFLVDTAAVSERLTKTLAHLRAVGEVDPPTLQIPRHRL
jgi:hypothetical protein